MLRVGDMTRSIDFYTRILGMRVLRTLEQPEDKYALAFLGFGDEASTCVLELTYHYGVSEYESVPVTVTSPSVSQTAAALVPR